MHDLTTAQKSCVEFCQTFIDKVEEPNFLNKITICEESRIQHLDPESKQ